MHAYRNQDCDFVCCVSITYRFSWQPRSKRLWRSAMYCILLLQHHPMYINIPTCTKRPLTTIARPSTTDDDFPQQRLSTDFRQTFDYRKYDTKVLVKKTTKGIIFFKSSSFSRRNSNLHADNTDIFTRRSLM